jgi:hypothetical protein
MKGNSPASYRLLIRYHRPKNIGGRSSAKPIWGSRNSPLQLRTRICTAKVFSQRISGEDFAKKKARSLRSRRGLSGRLRCSGRGFRSRRGRFRSRSRTGCFRCRRWRTRGCWACRGFGCLGLLLARRKERGTGQNADVFFHNVNWKRHIALTD